MATAKKLPSGAYRCRVYTGKNADGKKIYKSFTAPTKKQAEYLAAEYIAKKKRPAEQMTVGEAIDRYIASKDSVLSPTTISGYRKIRRNYLQEIMSIQIDKLTREHVQRAVNNDSRRVSAKTVISAHGLLAAALSMYNPDFVLHTRLPRKVKKLKNDLPTSEAVMRATAGTPVELPVMLAMCLCLRMSEVRGIMKQDIDGDFLRIERVIVTVDGQHITKTLAKTDSTRRIEELPPFIKSMILAQPSDHATELTGKAIYSRFTRLMAKAGYSGVRFHDLRHISASDMHAQGISDRVAAERGGWSGTQTMQQIYQHSFSADRKAADRKMIDYYEKMHDMTQNMTQKNSNQEDT